MGMASVMTKTTMKPAFLMVEIVVDLMSIQIGAQNVNALNEGKVWQYGLWSIQTGGIKLERFLPKNQHTQRKLLNFENWVNGELSKIGHHFTNKRP